MRAKPGARMLQSSRSGSGHVATRARAAPGVAKRLVLGAVDLVAEWIARQPDHRAQALERLARLVDRLADVLAATTLQSIGREFEQPAGHAANPAGGTLVRPQAVAGPAAPGAV